MRLVEKNRAIQVSRQNNSYYNGIAADYDFMLDKEASNKIIRQKVADQFGSVVKRGRVLDFGGGTGLDIGWMTRNHYQISFCEPSFAMRKLAMERARNECPASHISYMDESKTDFRNWSRSFPFESKVNAVLANFAVLNCIADIDLVFEKIALTLKTGGIFFALVLDSSFKKRMRSHGMETIQSLIFGKPVQIQVDYNGRHQLVYLHSYRGIRKALLPYFDLITCQHLEDFNLLQLKRK